MLKKLLMLIPLCALIWGVTGASRLFLAQMDLRATAREHFTQEQKDFVRDARVLPMKSLGPLLKKPLREDIRIYFVGNPPINSYPPDAYAVQEFGQWTLKIHN